MRPARAAVDRVVGRTGAMGQLRIQLLGGFSVYREGRSLAAQISQKPQSLFAYLATYRQRAHSREQLAGFLWGESSEARARSSLRTALYELRAALDVPGQPRCAIVNAKTIQFNTAGDFWLDIAEFEALLDRAAELSGDEQVRCWREAASLYRGDFMAGYYDEWCLLERERYQALCIDVLKRLIGYYRPQKDYGRAIEYAQRALMLNPLEEEAHRELIYLYYLHGDRNAALAQYKACREALQRELGVEPLPETQVLYRQISEDVERARQRLELSPGERTRFLLTHYGELHTPFVGRHRELKRLQLAWDLALSGRGGYGLIEGEPGIGKTRLVRELLQQLDLDDGVVLIGRCADWESSGLYHPLVEALRPRLGEIAGGVIGLDRLWQHGLASLFPELSDSTDLKSELSEAHLFEALHHLLMALCQQRPRLLFLDDLQWADLKTLAYLSQLAYRINHMPLLVIATYRGGYARKDSAMQQLLGTLAREGDVQQLSLKPLTERSVTTLVEGMLPLSGPGHELGRHLHRRCEGNPFFIVETVKELLVSGGLHLNTSGTWDIQHEAYEHYMPANVREVIAARVARLSPPAHRLLELGAVIGGALETELLAEVSRQPKEAILDGLEESHGYHLLMPVDRGYRFAHMLIQETVYQGIPAASRSHFHQLIGEMLEGWRARGRPALIELLAYHFYRAQIWPKALPYALQAGEQAKALHAQEVALTFYRHAKESADRLEEEGSTTKGLTAQRYAIAWAESECYHFLGRRQEEGEAINELLSWADRLRDKHAWLKARFREFEWCFAARQQTKALAVAQEALTIATALAEPATLATAHRNLGRAHWSLAQFEQAFDAYREAQRLLASVGDRSGIARTLNNLGVLHKSIGQYDLALQHYRKAHRLCRALDDEERILPLLNEGNLYMDVGQYRRALVRFRQSYRLSRQLGHILWELTALANMGESYGQLGDFRRALKLLGRATQRSRSQWPLHGEGGMHCQLGRIYYQQGKHQRALEHFAMTLHLMTKVPESMSLRNLKPEALAYTSLTYAALGRSKEALQAVRQALREAKKDALADLLPLIHFSHYQALLSANRDCQALAALDRARQALLERSQQIANPSMRALFLVNIRLHREIWAV